MYKRGGKKWSIKEQAVFLKQLGELLEKGYSLLHALEFLQIQLQTEKRNDIRQSIEALKNGDSLYAIFYRLQMHPDLLSYLYFAEQHGDIAYALQKGSTLLSKKQKRQEELKKILRYPVFLCVFLFFIFIIFNTVLLPQFSTLYASFHTESSLITTLLLYSIKILPILLGAAVLFTSVIVMLYFLYFKKLHPIDQMNWLLKIPFVKQTCLSLNSQYLSSQLSSLLSAGLSVLEALALMEKQKHHPFFQHEANTIKQMLINGERFETVVADRAYYEKQLIYVIMHGQANGTLAKELSDYSDMVMERLEAHISRLFEVIQPLLFAVVGITVVILYLAMLLPMFKMIHSI